MEFVWFMFRRLMVLFAALCVALGPLVLNLETFSQMLTTQFVGESAPIIGGVIITWFAKSPLAK